MLCTVVVDVFSVNVHTSPTARMVSTASSVRRGRSTATAESTTLVTESLPTQRTTRSTRRQQKQKQPSVESPPAPVRVTRATRASKTTTTEPDPAPITTSRTTRSSRAKKEQVTVTEEPAPICTTRSNNKNAENTDTVVTRSSRSRARKSNKSTPLDTEPVANETIKKPSKRSTKASQKAESSAPLPVRRSSRLRK